jgi:hypothetical protein
VEIAGRDRLIELLARFGSASHSAAHAIVLEPGIGKTVVWFRACEDAARADATDAPAVASGSLTVA